MIVQLSVRRITVGVNATTIRDHFSGGIVPPDGGTRGDMVLCVIGHLLWSRQQMIERKARLGT